MLETPDSQPLPPDDTALLQRLRSGDESAFSWLVDRYQSALIRLALIYVHEREIAEDVVQETWLGVLQGLARFEGRSSLKTWIFTILVNRARTRATREGRSVPLSALDYEWDVSGPTVDPDRFRSPADAWAGHWTSFPASWTSIPEARLQSLETLHLIQAAIDALPASQQQVILLRDVYGWESDEVCNVLSISETNQRVLLHRARASVRRALEPYLAPES